MCGAPVSLTFCEGMCALCAILLIGEARDSLPLWGRNILFPGLALIWAFFFSGLGERLEIMVLIYL